MGTRTYLAFYALVALSALIYTLQVVVLAILMSSSSAASAAERVLGSSAGLYAPAAIGIAGSLPVAAFYWLLWLFHTYLQVARLTTYEFLIQRDKRRREARKRRANATGMSSKAAPANGAAAPLAANPKPGDVADPPAPALDADGGGVNHHRFTAAESHPAASPPPAHEGRHDGDAPGEGGDDNVRSRDANGRSLTMV